MGGSGEDYGIGFVWTAESGEQPLLSFSQKHGVPLPKGATQGELGEGRGISGDGLTLAGCGKNQDHKDVSLVARLEAPPSLL